MKNPIWKKVKPIPPEMGGHGYLYECRLCGQVITSYTEPWILCPNCEGMKLEESYPPTEYEKKRSNADRIRAMSDEELAELLTAVAQKSANKLCESLKSVEVDLSNCNFQILYEAHLNWLRQEAE